MPRPQGGRKTNIDMTEGVIWKQLVLFAIPLIMGNVFQQLYNTVEQHRCGELSRNVGSGGCGKLANGDLQYAGEFL